jgi:hypothetical protein
VPALKTTPQSLERFPWALRVERFDDESIFTAPRSAWTPGEWQDEPDIVEWRLQGVPYPLLIVRGRTGCLCGYVAIPEGHALHGMWSGDAVRFTWSDLPEEINCAQPCEPTIFRATGEPPTSWWLGFHCGRSNELMPAVPLPESLGAVYVPLHQARARVEALGLALFRNAFPGKGRFLG